MALGTRRSNVNSPTSTAPAGTLGVLLIASGAITAAAMADGPSLQLGSLLYYESDGQTRTSVEYAHYAVYDVVVDFSAADAGRYSLNDAQLLGMYDVRVSADGVSSFIHDDIASAGTGTWDPGLSLDIPGLSSSRIDSFLTIGGGVGNSAPVNSTELLGETSHSSEFIHEAGIAWRNALEVNAQGAVDGSLRVLVGRFVLSGDELRACAGFEISGEIEYRYGFRSPDYRDESSARFYFPGCEPPSCDADIDGDGMVDGGDLSSLLGSWGERESAADFNDDGLVDGQDLSYLLGEWGDCL